MHLPRAIVEASFLLACTATWAGRPLQTEDAGVIEPRGCELEGAHGEWREPGAAQRRSSLQLSCGVGLGTELAVQAASPKERLLGGKTQVWTQDEAQLALAWSVAQRRQSGGWQRSNAGLTLVASRPWGRDWLVHANLGHLHDGLQRCRSTVWALAAEHNGLGPDARWQPMVEVFGDDRGQAWANAALRVVLVPGQLFVDGSLGRSVSRGATRLGTVGFILAF